MTKFATACLVAALQLASASAYAQEVEIAAGARLSVLTKSFENVPVETEIPGSSGAPFCALTLVDDKHLSGFCKVSFKPETSMWLYQTGSDGQQKCAVACLLVIIEPL